MEEDIKVLEEHLKFIKPFDNNSAYIPALENLIKEYKELEKKVNKYEKQIDLEWVEENYIEKSKVREFFEKSKVVKNESKDKTYLLIDVSELNEELLQEGDDK